MSLHDPQHRIVRSAAAYSELMPEISGDAAALQRALLADTRRRAHAIASARSAELKRAAAHRLCFDLIRLLRRSGPDTQREGENAAVCR